MEVTANPDPGRTERRLSNLSWLQTGPLARLLAVLDRDGEQARVVGGAVRNTLLQLPRGDIDVATTALPEEVVRRAEAAGFKPVPTGIEHGTVTVVVAGTPFEVTTLRQDVETFGRKAVVRFGREWKADAERRDFTMNALSVAADGTVYDYVGGLADLDARRVRFIGDPKQRIAEDYLRILRFFRFHAAYGQGAPDQAGLHACIAGRAGLELLSRERVRMELMKLLVAPGVVPAVNAMAEAGLIVPVLDGVPLLANLAAMVAIEAALGRPGEAARRLAAFAVLVAEDAERLWLRLRLTNAEHERLLSMADGWWRVSPDAGEQSARALLYRIGPESFADRGLLAWSRSTARPDDGRWRELVTLPDRWTAPKFPLKATDFIARGVPKGPQLGVALRAAETAWIAADYPNDPSVLKRLADAAADDALRAPAREDP
jgi:poly(A) polymerase